MISVSFFQRCIIYLFHDLPLLFQHSGVCRCRNVVPDICSGEFGMESVSFTKRNDGIDLGFKDSLEVTCGFTSVFQRFIYLHPEVRLESFGYLDR
jgi:hypothetical protein